MRVTVLFRTPKYGYHGCPSSARVRLLHLRLGNKPISQGSMKGKHCLKLSYPRRKYTSDSLSSSKTTLYTWVKNIFRSSASSVRAPPVFLSLTSASNFLINDSSATKLCFHRSSIIISSPLLAFLAAHVRLELSTRYFHRSFNKAAFPDPPKRFARVE